MGTLKQGILGGVSGKVGNVVGFHRKGKDIIRVQAATVSDARTPKQLKQRQKVAEAIAFLKPILPFIRIGYKNYAQERTAYNTATSYLMKRCISTNEEGVAVVDLQRVMVSIGFLNGAPNASASCETNKVVFGWEDNSGEGNAESTDIVMLLVYNKEKGTAVYNTHAGLRSASTASIPIPENWKKDSLATYLSFISADEEEVSNSIINILES